jgi:hypothetical protein
MSRPGKIWDGVATAGLVSGALITFSSLGAGVILPITLQFNDYQRLQQVIKTDLAEARAIDARMQMQESWMNKGLLATGGGLVLTFAGIAALGRRAEEDEPTVSPQSQPSAPQV